MSKTLFGTLAAAALTAAIAPVPAFAEAVAQTRVVRTDDLNLATPAGKAVLAKRIDVAARDVCKVTGARTVALGERAQSRSCMLAARSAAARQTALVAARDARGG